MSQPKDRAKGYRSDFSSSNLTTITVNIGPNKKPWVLHKAALCDVSNWFDNALNGEFGEVKNGIVNLHTEKEATFSKFVEWTYSSGLRDMIKVKETGCVIWSTAVNLYIFADKYDVPRLRLDVINAMHNVIHPILYGLPNWSIIPTIYDNLPEYSPLRHLVMDIFATRWDGQWIDEKRARELLPRDFMFDVLTQSIRRTISGPMLTTSDVCEYHGHVSEEEKRLCQDARAAAK